MADYSFDVFPEVFPVPVKTVIMRTPKPHSAAVGNRDDAIRRAVFGIEWAGFQDPLEAIFVIDPRTVFYLAFGFRNSSIFPATFSMPPRLLGFLPAFFSCAGGAAAAIFSSSSRLAHTGAVSGIDNSRAARCGRSSLASTFASDRAV